MSIAVKLLTPALMPLVVLVMMPAEEASARGRGGGGAGFSKPHGGGAHRHHGHRHFHGSRSSFGFFFGSAAFVPWYYGPGPGYWPSGYPTTYVEQDGYWYYCPALQAYYPYATECPGAEWQRLEPTAPPG